MGERVFDVAVVGGGIVGLATAMTLKERFPRRSVILIEKESRVAAHQTGHNSGVIHAGIYYKPGSSKARLCVEGVRRMEEFCDAHGVRYERCGKVIVATSEDELPRLEGLYDRGRANGVPGLEMISPERLRTIEPHARAIRAIHSRQTAVVDFAEVARAMERRFRGNGGEVRTEERLRSISESRGTLELRASENSHTARYLINCAGLYADSVARLMGIRTDVQIIPFRGEYYLLRPSCRLVRGLIYPVPDPAFPFLGVHFTKRIQGGYDAGPNAVLALAREGYRRRDLNPSELLRMVAFRGFWAMTARHWKTGLYEMYRSLNRRLFVRDLQRLVPEIREEDLAAGGSGVRAQAVRADGSLVDDFEIRQVPNAIHVLNAPSPAATASIAIGAHIVGLVEGSFDL